MSGYILVTPRILTGIMLVKPGGFSLLAFGLPNSPPAEPPLPLQDSPRWANRPRRRPCAGRSNSSLLADVATPLRLDVGM